MSSTSLTDSRFPALESWGFQGLHQRCRSRLRVWEDTADRIGLSLEHTNTYYLEIHPTVSGMLEQVKCEGWSCNGLVSCSASPEWLIHHLCFAKLTCLAYKARKAYILSATSIMYNTAGKTLCSAFFADLCSHADA